jgi:N-acyl-L-homoserine lactone synthetase
MAEVIWRGNRDQYLLEIDEMHARRDAVFFEQMGWNREAAGIRRGWDQDQFDDDDAIYLIQKNARTGRLVAHCRFLRTDRRHMMTDVWPQLCHYPDGIPAGSDILEFTRVCYDWEQMEPGEDYRKWVRASFVSAVTEFCIRQGVTAITFVVTKKHYLNIQRNLWRTIPLGDYWFDKNIGQELIAAKAEIDADALSRIRANLLGSEEPVLFYRGPMHSANVDIVRAA